MFVAGFLFSTPYMIRLGKAAVYVIASSPEEFPDLDVDTEEVEVEDVDPMDAAEFRPVERVSIEELETRDYSSVEELLAIPDEMRIEPYPDYVEVKRYWVRAPYSYVCILKDDSQGDYRYYIVEPEILEGEEELVLEEFNQRLSTTLLFKHIDDDYEDDETEEAKVRVIEQEVLRLANEYNISVNEETFHKLLYFIERDFVYYGKIDTLRRDPDVEDISCDGNNIPLFVYHRHYNDLMTNVKFQKQELRQFIIELAQRSGEHISAADPLLDASLPNGSRIQMSLGDEITTHGSTFTIRLFQDEPFTPIDLIHYKTFSLEQMAYLWLAIENDKSLIFSGGTASGKTTSMNAISLFIPPKAKVVTIEDTREIQLPHQNWIPSVTRDGFGGTGGEGNGAVTMNDLLRSALRQRPEYMVVGEIRGQEAETLFQAMSTGHTTYSTMHADTVKRAINRLSNPPINVPLDMISSLDIICVQNQVRRTDPETGETENVRRNEQTDEIVEINDEVKRTITPFKRDAERDEMRSNLEESHVLKQIRLEQGMTEEEIRQELADRQRVLKHLYDEDIRDAKAVTRVIQAYMLNKRNVLNAIDAGTLDPDDFKDITEVEFTIKQAQSSSDGLSRLFGEIENHNPDDETDSYYGLTEGDESAVIDNGGDEQ
jgi:flagellar protein FlaI